MGTGLCYSECLSLKNNWKQLNFIFPGKKWVVIPFFQTFSQQIGSFTNISNSWSTFKLFWSFLNSFLTLYDGGFSLNKVLWCDDAELWFILDIIELSLKTFMYAENFKFHPGFNRKPGNHLDPTTRLIQYCDQLYWNGTRTWLNTFIFWGQEENIGNLYHYYFCVIFCVTSTLKCSEYRFKLFKLVSSLQMFS